MNALKFCAARHTITRNILSLKMACNILSLNGWLYIIAKWLAISHGKLEYLIKLYNSNPDILKRFLITHECTSHFLWLVFHPSSSLRPLFYLIFHSIKYQNIENEKVRWYQSLSESTFWAIYRTHVRVHYWRVRCVHKIEINLSIFTKVANGAKVDP